MDMLDTETNYATETPSQQQDYSPKPPKKDRRAPKGFSKKARPEKKPPKPITLFTQKHFSGVRFLKRVIRDASKILKLSESRTITFLEQAIERDGSAPPDVTPPVHNTIMAVTRPFEEWPEVILSKALQKHCYALTKKIKIKTWPKKGPGKKCLAAWSARTKIPLIPGQVQATNGLFDRIGSIYDGVEKKVTNRNANKKLEYDEAIKEGRNPAVPEYETAYNIDGTLINKPGYNPNLYITQSRTPRLITEADRPLVEKILWQMVEKKTQSRNQARRARLEKAAHLQGLPVPKFVPEKVDRSQKIEIRIIDPLDKIEPYMPQDRMAIKASQDGHVPYWQRPFLSKRRNRRVRAGWGKQVSSIQAWLTGALLVIVRLGNEAFLADIRGALRNAQWRKLLKPDATYQSLFNLFTGDPVVNTRTNHLTMAYREGVVDIVKSRSFKGRQTREHLLTLLGQGKTVAGVSFDLGQKHAAGLLAAHFGLGEDGNPVFTPIQACFLPQRYLDSLTNYRNRYDALTLDMRRQSLLALTPAQQQEFADAQRDPGGQAKRACCLKLNLNPDEIRWDLVSGISTMISDLYIERGGDPRDVHQQVETKPKGKRKSEIRILKIRDGKWAYDFRPKIADETRKAQREQLWKLQKASSEFERLSRYKINIARAIANWALQWGRELSGCDIVIPVLEDLNVGSKFFDGKGKWLLGWDNRFTPKKENRWFIKVLHKAVAELAPHRGVPVYEVMPHRTSMTCPACHYCHPTNREGDRFECQSCHVVKNTDRDVAPYNILRVAVEGKTLDRWQAEKKPQAEPDRPMILIDNQES